MGDFGFAFNDFDFSDRVLGLVIIPDCFDSRMNLREEKYHDSFSSINADHSNHSESIIRPKVVRLHINSAILAAKSPFFYKLFKNGKRKLQHKNSVFLRIKASEEASLMDLLKFMYENTLSATSAPDLIGVLIAADKFEVASCMRQSIEMLLKLPVSLEYAIFCLELPSSILESEIVKPLVDEAKKYVKDFTKYRVWMKKLHLSAVEVVLGSEGLEVISEDDVYDFILEWARVHYTELEERREILTKRLVKLICFPNMSSSKLKEVLVCPEFDHEEVSNLVLEALFSKVETSNDLATTTNYGFFSGRVYKPRCVIYFDLKRDELKRDELKSITMSSFKSQTVYLAGKMLYLSARWNLPWNPLGEKRLSLYVCAEPGYGTCVMDFEFAVMMNKSSKKFISMHKASNITLMDFGRGFSQPIQAVSKPFELSWTDLMSNDEYYINDILHVRTVITLLNSCP